MGISKQAIEKYDGRVITFICTDDVTVGDVIPLGTEMIGIAVNSGLTGENISLEIEKVWIIKAKTADAVSVGDVLYWDATEKELTKTETSNTRAGIAMSSKTAVAGVVEVKINA